ncbi:MAG: hypothetical protein ACOCVZ_01390 [Gemmatimonadota bacterium]
MVTAVAACDNVDWGGLDLAVVPPPPKTGPTSDVEPGDRLPAGPILYHVLRDTAEITAIPVAEIVDDELHPIAAGDDPAAFGQRFITTFFRQNAELTLFHNGRRAGSLTVDSAWVPTGPVCRPVPRATGSVQLTDDAGEVTEFLAMARTQAPEGRMIPAGELEVEGRMQTVGNILAERALRARDAQLPNWSRARRQIQPFPVVEARDAGFTATFLADDELAVGNDDEGYSLFIVYTPQAQVGYDTAYVDFVSYTAEGKAAPRTIDFLDWDRDGRAELLLEVFGTRNSWYAAVGSDGDEWRQIFEARCVERPLAEEAADTAVTDTTDTAAPGPSAARTPTRPGAGPIPNRTSLEASPLLFPDIEPRVQLVDPNARPRRTVPRDTQPDTSGVRLGHS